MPERAVTFREIYERHIWGGQSKSGRGSELPNVRQYKTILQSIVNHPDVSSVVDIGCGDWTFSSLIDWSTIAYTGIEIVPELVDTLEAQHGNQTTHFLLLDAIDEDLPSADLCILKDVLQHWSQASIETFLPKLRQYRYALITHDVKCGVWQRRGNEQTLVFEVYDESIEDGGYRPLDITSSPYSLSVKFLKEYSTLYENVVNVKRVALWTRNEADEATREGLCGFDSVFHEGRDMATTAGRETPLTISNSAEQIGRYLDTLGDYTGDHRGRGIVIPGGAGKYLACTWVCARMLRHLGCKLPIQVWYLGQAEYDETLSELLDAIDVEYVDAFDIPEAKTHLSLGGWPLKPFAILHSPFREVLLLDADNVPVAEPTFLFDTPEYRETGAIFWPDFWRSGPDKSYWKAMGVPFREEYEFESGQILIDKSRCWAAIQLANWMCERGEIYFFQHSYGDKDCFRAAWQRSDTPYTMPEHGVTTLSDLVMVQYDLEGKRLFQHRNIEKWTLDSNRRIDDFHLEEECLNFLDQLRREFFTRRLELSQQDVRDTEALAGVRFRYTRCGHDGRVMGFGTPFVIEEGAGGWERIYYCKDGNLHIAGSGGDLTCRLRPICGFWAGRWANFERMPIVMEPIK